MPLCFWATQTAVVALDLCVGVGWPTFTPYLPPYTAATAIQHAYHSYYVDKEWEWGQKLSWAGYALECKMDRAMHDLQDSNTFNFLVCDYYWMPCLDNG
jgi:hypothetical protein